VGMANIVYKICSRDVWEQAVVTGYLSGTEDDLRDGFIHFSAPHQIRATARKHFFNQENLVLLEINAPLLGDNLKWERSHNGELFPHLYDIVDVSLVSHICELPLTRIGEHIFPAEVPI